MTAEAVPTAEEPLTKSGNLARKDERFSLIDTEAILKMHPTRLSQTGPQWSASIRGG